MEVAGLVLAILPTVTEGFNLYFKAAEALTIFKQYPSIVVKLQITVKTQRTIFGNSAGILKFAVTGYIDALKRGQRSQAPPEIEARVEDSLEACCESLGSIANSLDAIVRKLKAFNTDGNTIGDSISSKVALNNSMKLAFREFSNRFRLVWSKNHIDEEVSELRRFVRDFDKLSTQAIDLILSTDPKMRGQTRQMHIEWSCGTEETESLAMFKQIRQASSDLHLALKNHWLCSTHKSHTVNISSAEYENKQFLSFEAVLAVFGSGDTNEPICMEVESGDHLQNITMVAATNALESLNHIKYGFDALKPGLRSHPSVDVEDGQGCSAEVDNSQSTRATGPDLRQIEDFCGHFKEQSKTAGPGKQSLGYLPELTMQRFFSLAPDRRVVGPPYSLAEFIGSSNMPSSFSRLETADIAVSLATSILQFHSTPWLPEDWSSNDVIFFQKNSSLGKKSNPLYFSVQLEPQVNKGKGIAQVDKGKGIELASGPFATTIRGLDARSEILFRLGVVLLETGLARPWESLRREVLESNRAQARTNDYHISYTLARDALPLRMGPQYSKITRKCLGCDFGLGENDFNSDDLQATFLSEVVLGLKAVKRSLVKFQQHGFK